MWRASTQYSSSLPRGVSLGLLLLLLLLLLWFFFPKCLLGGLAIFMMADNKEQRVREVLFSVRDCSEQKKKLHAHSLFFFISHHKNRQTS
jgi:hypothetical protein